MQFLKLRLFLSKTQKNYKWSDMPSLFCSLRMNVRTLGPTVYQWDMKKCWNLLLLWTNTSNERIISFFFSLQIKTTSWLSSRTQLNDYADLEWGFFPFAQLFFFNLMVKNRALVLILLCHFNNVWKNKSRCFCCLQTEKAALFFFCITSRFEDELVN